MPQKIGIMKSAKYAELRIIPIIFVKIRQKQTSSLLDESWTKRADGQTNKPIDDEAKSNTYYY